MPKINVTPEQIQELYDKYNNGTMNPDQQVGYIRAVKKGDVTLPEGAELEIPVLDQEMAEALRSGKLSLEQEGQIQFAVDEGILKLPEEKGFLAGIKDAFTGSDRSTPEIESLPDWSKLPEKNQFNMDAMLSALNTMSTDPKETAQIIKAGFPGVDVRQDEKGNYILKSGVDQQEYAIKPGFRASDIPRAGFTAAEFTPAGKAKSIIGGGLKAIGTQAAVETGQALAGGEFDVKEVGAAGLAGAGGAAVGKIGDVVRNTYQKFFSKAPAVVETAEDIASIAKDAAKGSTKKQLELAGKVQPDPKLLKSADRLGVTENLQARHITTNEAYREIEQAVASVPGSTSRTVEKEAFAQVSKKADDFINKIGTQDLSQMSKDVKQVATKIQASLDAEGAALFKKVGEAIAPKTEARATNLLKFLKTKSDELGGAVYLNSVEKKLLKQLQPKMNMRTGKLEYPTYARLDDVRKQLTAARVAKQGDFKDAQSGLLRKLEVELLKDQQIIAEKFGVLETFNKARQTVAVRKGLENDIINMFGKHMEGSIVGDLKSGIKKLAIGDVTKFTELIKKVPDNLKQQVTTSGLAEAFGKKVSQGQMNFTSYANWYEGLMNNKQARNALFINLPEGSRKQLTDLYRVAKGLSKSSKEKITTGRLNVITNQMRSGDGFMRSVYNFARRSSGRAAEFIGVPGAGLMGGLLSALKMGKTDIMVAADKLITSPAFLSAARQGNKQAAGRLSRSTAWKDFYTAAGRPKELDDAQKWILSAFQSQRNLEGE